MDDVWVRLTIRALRISHSHTQILPPQADPAYLAKAQAIRDKEGRDPVVVLNGLGGAGLKFRLRGAQPAHFYCRTWYARWYVLAAGPPVCRMIDRPMAGAADWTDE